MLSNAANEATPVDLDEIDKQLIAALTRDGRVTFKALAVEVGLSDAATRVRVRRLLDTGIVRIVGRVDPASLGFGLYAFLWLRLAVPVEDAIAVLSECPEVAYITEISGRIDLAVEARLTDRRGLSLLRDRLVKAGIAREIDTSWVLAFDKLDWTGVGNHEARPPAAPVAADPSTIDAIDRRLALELLQDGRMTYAALADAVGLSQPSVRERVVRLLSNRIVTIHAMMAADAAGVVGTVGLLLNVEGSAAPVAEALGEMVETTMVLRTLGPHDMVVEIWYDDTDHLVETLTKVRDLPGVQRVETLPYLNNVVYQPPTKFA